MASAPAEWRVLLQFPEAGDPLNDAVTAWPADRRTLEVGRLRITSVQAPGQAGADEPAGMDTAEFGGTERDDWENGTERDDFDGIRETPGKSGTNNDGEDFDPQDRNPAQG